MVRFLQKTLQEVLDLVLPHRKRKRLQKERLLQEMEYLVRKVLNEDLERTQREWDLTPYEHDLLEEIMSSPSDQDFSHYRFQIPSQNTQNARLVDLLKSLTETLHHTDHHRGQDAFEWLLKHSTTFNRRCNQIESSEMESK